jgi:hypothetical protein
VPRGEGKNPVKATAESKFGGEQSEEAGRQEVREHQSARITILEDDEEEEEEPSGGDGGKLPRGAAGDEVSGGGVSSARRTGLKRANARDEDHDDQDNFADWSDVSKGEQEEEEEAERHMEQEEGERDMRMPTLVLPGFSGPQDSGVCVRVCMCVCVGV